MRNIMILFLYSETACFPPGNRLRGVVMPTDETMYSNAHRELKLSMEERANAFNLKCLLVLCAFTLLCAVCNRIGIFTVDPFTMKVAVITAFLTFFAPILVWLLHDKVFGAAPTILRWNGF